MDSTYIEVPDGALPPVVTASVAVKVIFAGQFELPKDCQLITVEPVYPDPGKCGHLHKADAKLWSRIASHLPTLSTHLQFTDTSVF